MKALELKVWTVDECGSYEGYYDYEHDDLDPESYAHSKRFTDAELAAEMHAANADAWRAHSAKGPSLPMLEVRFETLARFGRLPHHDEQP